MGTSVEIDFGSGFGYLPLNLWGGVFSLDVGGYRSDGPVSLRARAVAVNPMTGERLEGEWKNLNFELKRYELTGKAFGVGWEGGALAYLIEARGLAGAISWYSVDIDNDGTFDYGNLPHYDEIQAGLDLNVPLPPGNAVRDNGAYTSRIRVYGASGISGYGEFQVPLRIGNIPPRIAIQGENGTEPEETTTLQIGASDPGPDTVTSLVVDWGDGTTESFASSSAIVSHAYAEDGSYTVTVTATDEDGTWTAKHLMAIGFDATPTPPPIRVVGSNATVTGDSATLTVQAEGLNGPYGLSYSWATPPGIYGTLVSGNQVTFNRLGPNEWFEVDLTITDPVGNSLEVRYAFKQPGFVFADPVPSIGNYRKLFMDETPEMPSDWEVHHVYQVGRTVDDNEEVDRVLERRFREAGINVNSPINLRGVRSDIHLLISKEQKEWWLHQRQKNGNVTFKALAETIDLNEYKQFAERLEVSYRPFMVKAGATAKVIAAATDAFDNKGGKQLLTITKASRRAAYAAVAGFAFFTLFTDNAQAMQAIANHSPAQNDAFDRFATKYSDCLEESIRIQRVKTSSAQQVVQTFVAYLSALQLDADVIGKLNVALNAYIPERLY